MTETAFEAAVRRHDAKLAALGLDIWVGAEPTFTDRQAQTPEWLNQPLGGDKEQRAAAVLVGLRERLPGSVILRCVGRQYPGEDLPRWNYGLYRRRDGAPIWPGPPDPLLLPDRGAAPDGAIIPDLAAWGRALAAGLEAAGWLAQVLTSDDSACCRVLLRLDPSAPPLDLDDPALARPSVHGRAIPVAGLRDELAEAGSYLFLLRQENLEPGPVPCVELPALPDVASFQSILAVLAASCRDLTLDGLLLAGYPPPVDATVEWTTLTPDPAVIEINAAPSVDATEFLARSRLTHAAAGEQGLSPYRLYFNGVVADSGGAGQLTLGGPAPEASPFIRMPGLLPRLVCYLNRHPALSYLFAHDYVGSGGQSVRSDERGADALYELGLTLSLLQRAETLSPDLLWRSLTHFLCDAAGNSHRAEINIEKLWNPYLPGRGRLGLVEFRALRMQHTPERAVALACLLRAVVAMLAADRDGLELVDWGRDLHERFALPFYLQQDLLAVLEDLARTGLELDAPLRAVLLADEFRDWGRVSLPGCGLEVRHGVEFWPLLGDAASPEQGGGYRIVDASTQRLELRLRPNPADTAEAPGWGDWRIFAAGIPLPLRHEQDSQGPARVYGLRYRGFAPFWGMHPSLGAQGPIRLLLRHPRLPQDYWLTLHEWRPDGQAYAGLPDDLDDAARRRAERLTLRLSPRVATPEPASQPLPGLGPYSLDLRYQY